MKKQYSSRGRPLLVAALFAVGAAGSVSAQVDFAGYTQGCYGTSCSAANSATLGGLVFTRQTDFTATTVNGFVGTAHLGLFTLDNTLFGYTGNTFTLLINFSLPTLGQQNWFTAALRGDVVATEGGVFIDFPINNLQTWTDNSNTYGVEINDLSIQRGQTLEVSGNLYSTTVPEPTSLILLGSGLLGLGGLRRRRKHS